MTQQRTSELSKGQTDPSDESPKLTPEMYQQLKSLAHYRLQSYRPSMTLNCTALVHEAFLKIQPGIEQLNGGAGGDHFLALASMAMRQILVDYVRQRKADKRGGGALHVTLQESLVPASEGEVDLLGLDAALTRLATRDAELEKLVVLRFFAGLTMEQVARALNRSKRSVERDWTRARIYLYQELGSGQNAGSDPASRPDR